MIDHDGNTPLTQFCVDLTQREGEREKCVETNRYFAFLLIRVLYLLSQGANVFAKNNNGDSALSLCDHIANRNPFNGPVVMEIKMKQPGLTEDLKKNIISDHEIAEQEGATVTRDDTEFVVALLKQEAGRMDLEMAMHQRSRCGAGKITPLVSLCLWICSLSVSYVLVLVPYSQTRRKCFGRAVLAVTR